MKGHESVTTSTGRREKEWIGRRGKEWKGRRGKEWRRK